MVHKDIVNKLSQIQDTMKSSLQKSAEQGTVSAVTDLWSDNVVSLSYFNVTFFGWRNQVLTTEYGPSSMLCTHAIFF